MLVKLDDFPNFRGVNSKNVSPNHHLALDIRDGILPTEVLGINGPSTGNNDGSQKRGCSFPGNLKNNKKNTQKTWKYLEIPGNTWKFCWQVGKVYTVNFRQPRWDFPGGDWELLKVKGSATFSSSTI